MRDIALPFLLLIRLPVRLCFARNCSINEETSCAARSCLQHPNGSEWATEASVLDLVCGMLQMLVLVLVLVLVLAQEFVNKQLLKSRSTCLFRINIELAVRQVPWRSKNATFHFSFGSRNTTSSEKSRFR
jgi:hypothetical protein